MKVLKETCYKGTRILVGNKKRNFINGMINSLISKGYEEIQIPIIQYEGLFIDKVGEENNNMMYTFKDRGNRDLCLAPEYTAVIQQLADTVYKGQKDVKLFYVAECFRGEKPQAGRYRQFTQLGVEILNPSEEYDLGKLAMQLIADKYTWVEKRFELNIEVTRGLDYYEDGKGFEITCNELGSSKQVCGGGAYDGGVGFALGIDRLLEIPYNNDEVEKEFIKSTCK